MAAIASPIKPLRCYVSYGFLGGEAHGGQMRQLLQSAGYQITLSPETADIIVAHSAGYWQLPENIQASLVVMIGLPLVRPSAAVSFRSNRKRMRSFIANGHTGKLIRISLLNVYYGLIQPRRNLMIIRQAKQLQASTKPPHAKQLVVLANRYDPWPKAPQLATLLAEQPWAFISLDGSHDHIWETPGTYVAIINHYARLLA